MDHPSDEVCECVVSGNDFCKLCPLLGGLLERGLVSSGAAMIARDAKVADSSFDLKDVVGQTEAKKKISDLVRAIKQPGLAYKSPISSSKNHSLLLCGRQGSGKTLLLDAALGEISSKINHYNQVAMFLTGADQMRWTHPEDVLGFLDCVVAVAANTRTTVLCIDDIDVLLEDIRQETSEGEIYSRVCCKLKALFFSPSVVVVATARQPWLLPTEFLRLNHSTSVVVVVRLSPPSIDDRRKIVKRNLMGFPLNLTKEEWERMCRDLALLSQKEVAGLAEGVADEARRKLREAKYFRRVSEDDATGESHYSPSVDGEVLEICPPCARGAFRSSLAEIAQCQFALRLPSIGLNDLRDHFLAAHAVSSFSTWTEEDRKFTEFVETLKANEGKKVSHAMHKSVMAYVATAVRNLPKFSYSSKRMNKI